MLAVQRLRVRGLGSRGEESQQWGTGGVERMMDRRLDETHALMNATTEEEEEEEEAMADEKAKKEEIRVELFGDGAPEARR